LEEQAHCLLHGGDRVAGGAVITVQSTVQQPEPVRRAMGMLQENLGWLAGAHRIRDPTQYIVQAASGERGGVEERLDDFRRLGGIEAGGVVTVPAARRCLDCAGGERFSAPLRHHRIDTARDRIPHQLRQSSRKTERIEYQTGPTIPRPHRKTQQKIIDLGQGHQRRARGVQQSGGQKIEGLAAALRADHPGGAVPRHPQIPAPGIVRSAEMPTDGGRIEDHPAAPCRSFRYRSGRTIFRLRRNRVTPSSLSASPRVATPLIRPGPQRSKPNLIKTTVAASKISSVAHMHTRRLDGDATGP
jgi:hypothetical protein